MDRLPRHTSSYKWKKKSCAGASQLISLGHLPHALLSILLCHPRGAARLLPCEPLAPCRPLGMAQEMAVGFWGPLAVPSHAWVSPA